MPTNLDLKEIRELRILPRNQCFWAELVYKLDVVETKLNPNNALGVDPGMDNGVTCVSTTEVSLLMENTLSH
jgi:transposase